MQRATLLLVLAVALPACVSTGTHEALQKECDARAEALEDVRDELALEKAAHEDARQRLAESLASYDARLEELGRHQTAIKALEAELGERESRLDELARSLGDTKAELARLQEQVPIDAAEIDRLRAQQEAINAEVASLSRERAQLEGSLEQLRVALADIARRKAEADRRVAQFRDLLARFKTLIDAGTLQVRMSEGRMVLVLPTDVIFDSGSARLSEKGKSAILQVGETLAPLSDRRFQVEGHTDDVPIRNARFASNWQLAAARAQVVVDTMLPQGIAGERLSAASFGEFRPAANNDDPERRATNRRIEIVLVPDLSSLPGYEELEALVKHR